MRWLAVIVGLFAGGCLSERHDIDAPTALPNFCDSFFDALCGPLEACGCGVRTVAECRDEERRICGDYPVPALEDAVEDGRVVYDEEAAAALLERLGARGCDGFVTSLEWRVSDLFVLGGAFRGAQPAGAPCASLGFELISECHDGTCVPGGDGQICRALAGEGEACGPMRQCVDFDGALMTGGTIDRLTLRCEPDAPGSDEGTCRAWVPEGGDCSVDGECWTSHCVDDRCVGMAEGEPCLSTRECAASLYCADFRCAPAGAPVDAPCGDDAACASRVCVGGVCRPAGCDTF